MITPPKDSGSDDLSPLAAIATLTKTILVASLQLLNIVLMVSLPILAAVVILGWMPTVILAFFS